MSKFEISTPPIIHYGCDFAVGVKDGDPFLCYCTSRARAELIVKALEALDNSKEPTVKEKR